MPKGPKNAKGRRIGRKHRIGSRKGGQNGHMMKTGDLLVLAHSDSPDRRKDRVKAQQVLNLRNKYRYTSPPQPKSSDAESGQLSLEGT